MHTIPVDDPLEVQIGPLLLARGLWLTLAESCTGGLLSHYVTNVPGSSRYYLGSVISYSNIVKQHTLGVHPDVLFRDGAVSRRTVLQMAAGVRSALRGEIPLDEVIGVSISGVAGPDGGTPEKPVGTVWIGLSAPEGDWAWRFCWQGHRLENKESSARQALSLLADYLNNRLPGESFA